MTSIFVAVVFFGILYMLTDPEKAPGSHDSSTKPGDIDEERLQESGFTPVDEKTGAMR